MTGTHVLKGNDVMKLGVVIHQYLMEIEWFRPVLIVPIELHEAIHDIWEKLYVSFRRGGQDSLPTFECVILHEIDSSECR